MTDPTKKRRKSEQQKLVEFFRSDEGEALGRQGDHDNLTPAETAIRAIRDLRVELKEAHELYEANHG